MTSEKAAQLSFDIGKLEEGNNNGPESCGDGALDTVLLRQVSPASGPTSQASGRRSRAPSEASGRRSRAPTMEKLDVENDTRKGPGLLSRNTIYDVTGLVRPYFTSPSSRRFAWFLVFLSVATIIIENAMATLWLQSQGKLIDALGEKDSEKVEHNIFRMAVILPTWFGAHWIKVLVLGSLKIEWRRFAASDLFKDYLSQLAYYRLQFGDGRKVDNPDQRMCQDIDDFVDNFVEFSSGQFYAIVVLVVFLPLLWARSQQLAGFLLIFGPCITFMNLGIFGNRLARWTRLVSKQEASLRFAFIRIREHSESIAFLRGESFEHAQCQAQFDQMLGTHYRRLFVNAFYQGFNLLTTSFTWLIPPIVMYPAIIRGDLTVGELVLAQSVFNHARFALSHCTRNLDKIAEIGAEARRISALKSALELDAEQRGTSDIGEDIVTQEMISPSSPSAENSFKGHARDMGTNSEGVLLKTVQAPPNLSVQSLCLWPPMLTSAEPRSADKRVLSNFSLTLNEGDSLLISGESGLGKSSLLRAIGGLWLRGTGCIQRCPADQICFQPQNPYMCIGTLRQQVLYPNNPTKERPEQFCSDEEIKAALVKCNVGYLVDRWGLDEEKDFSLTLSLGEQQRLSFTRLLVRPGTRLALLDESTSALDEANEALLYNLLRETCTTFVSVGHRESLHKFHTHRLSLSRSDTGASILTPMPVVPPPFSY